MIFEIGEGIIKGMNYVEAFHDAVSKQKNMLGKLSDYAMAAGDDPGDYSQEPQYDDTIPETEYISLQKRVTG